MAYRIPEIDQSDAANPLEMIEQIVAAHDWPFDRSNDEELSVAVAGAFCEFHLCFAWRHEHQALQLSCAFDSRVPEAKRTQIYTLLGMINENLWLGHFDLWSEEGLVLFRYALLAGNDLGADRCEDMIDVAIAECERFYPALQFVLWGGKTPREAVEAAMFDTVGEA